MSSNAGLIEAHALLAARPVDFGRLLPMLGELADAGDARADYALAQLGVGALAGLEESQTLAHWLRAAQADLPAALRSLALVLLATGLEAEAAAAFERAAALGDRLAAQLRATIRTPAGTLPAFPPKAIDAHQAAAPVVHHQRPYLATIDDALAPVECAYLIALAGPGLVRATTMNPVTGAFTVHPSRTNRESPLDVARGDLATRFLERRLARLAGSSIAHAEYMTVLCYRPGEEYRPHRDYLNPASVPGEFAPAAGGQRLRTLFVYLNPVTAGGATDFPALDVRITPKRGMAVMFDNVDNQGAPDPNTLHAGMPVERGEKWLATLWFRERPLRSY